VVVDETKLNTRTDTLGTFVLDDVPIGQIRVEACAPGYMSSQTAIQVPQDHLAIRLRRDPRVRITRRCP
jgi:hypothetical protein